MQPPISFPTWAQPILLTMQGFAYQSYGLFYALLRQGISLEETLSLHQQYLNYEKAGTAPTSLPGLEARYGLALGIWHLVNDPNLLKSEVTALESLMKEGLDENLHMNYGANTAFVKNRQTAVANFLHHLLTESASNESIVISKEENDSLLEQFQIDRLKQNISVYLTPVQISADLTLDKDRPILIVSNGIAINQIPHQRENKVVWEAKIFAHELLNGKAEPGSQLRLSKPGVSEESKPDTDWMVFGEHELGTQSVIVWYCNPAGKWTMVETYVLVQHPFMELPEGSEWPAPAFEAMRLIVYNGLAAPLVRFADGWKLTVGKEVFLKSEIPHGYQVLVGGYEQDAPFSDTITFKPHQCGTQTVNIHLYNEKYELVTKVQTYLLVQAPFSWENLAQIEKGCTQLLDSISDQLIVVKNGIAIGNYRGEPFTVQVQDIIHPAFMSLVDRCFILDQQGTRSKQVQYDMQHLGTQVVTILFEDENGKVHLISSYVLVQGYAS
jgi:hypothetical protein